MNYSYFGLDCFGDFSMSLVTTAVARDSSKNINTMMLLADIAVNSVYLESAWGLIAALLGFEVPQVKFVLEFTFLS